MKTRAGHIKDLAEVAQQEFDAADDTADDVQTHLLRSIAASLLALTKGQEDLRRRPF